jgi:hypothetical protein
LTGSRRPRGTTKKSVVVFFEKFGRENPQPREKEVERAYQVQKKSRG